MWSLSEIVFAMLSVLYDTSKTSVNDSAYYDYFLPFVTIGTREGEI